ncbi:MAG: glycoside hydrolase family 127 protein [Bacteroidia bacterium]
MKRLIHLLFLFSLIMCCQENKQSSQGENFLSNVNQVKLNIEDNSDMLTFFDRERTPVKPAFTCLPSGSNKPQGWLLDIMQNDLQKGIVGALDDLYPGIVKDDLYFTARRGGMEDIPEMGDLQLTGAEWETSIMWWNAETIGNWWDGFVRHAFLTNDEKAINQSHQIVANLLNSQDEDGYIGIYKKNLRYQHEGSNGELWAQTTAFRMLLAYYEFTQDRRVLEAVEKAMAVTIKNYGEEGKNPFYLKNAFGGVTHGLMMTDVCETLYRITGNQTYQDYATYLYRAFSTYSINRAFNDLRYPYLLEKDSLFTGHGVHTYEHLRSLLNAWYDTGYPELETAFSNAMYKLDFCMLPSGAGHGNEWIAGMKADPNETSTEYCTMLELRNFFTSAMQKTGDISFADKAEKLTFNGMMGFRNAEGTAITYGKGDNCFVLDGHHHGKEEQHEDVRYKYSPTHSDPAVCCVPNYTRNYSYYLDQMWLKDESGLTAMLYGPSELTTTIDGKQITITQETNYPFSDQIIFKIKVDEPVKTTLSLRKPQWSEKVNVQINSGDVTEADDFLRVEKEWQNGDEMILTFEHKVKYNELASNEVYLQRGPLVYAYPIPHREEVIKTYAGTDFKDYYCKPLDDQLAEVTLPYLTPIVPFAYQELPLGENPWYKDLPTLTVPVASPEGVKEIQLVPMGSTVLRRVSFSM